MIDTLAYWAAMPSHREKDAGSAQAVMQRLLDAASEGVAVLLVMHQRKGGGEDGEGLRGSGAFAGAANIVVELERTQNPRERVLLTLSRYPSTPGSLVVNHGAATGAWSVVGEDERGEARSIVDRQAIITALGHEPRSDAAAHRGGAARTLRVAEAASCAGGVEGRDLAVDGCAPAATRRAVRRKFATRLSRPCTRPSN